ncbi:MAG: EamA family transporter [Rhizobiaceae bacterium]|nr:EamA family transporter [Rhizobiaceae bacterium]
MERKSRIDAFGATSLILFAALLGLNQVLVKVVNGGLQPVFQAGLRSLCVLPILLIFALIAKRRLSISDGSLIPGVIAGGCFAAEFILLFLALDYTTVSRASVFFYTMPFWVALGAHVIIPGERLTGLRLTGLAMAIAGVVIALSHNNEPATEYALIGDLVCLVGAILWAAIALIARTTNLNKSSPEMQLIYQVAVSAPLILIVAPLFGPLIRDLQAYHLAIFSFQVVVVVCFGFSAWFWLLSKYPASDMASFTFFAPVFGVAFGWLLLDEPVGLRLLAALALVGAGIVLVNRKPKSAT